MSAEDKERKRRIRSALVESVSLRRHAVDLERAQRLHLGLDNEQMEFSATTIAEMVQDIAHRCDENDAFTLHAVARALRGDDEHHWLQLKHKKRGRFVSPTDRERQFQRSMEWLRALARLELDGIKTESAVAKISEEWGVSRASVFQTIREAEAFLSQGARHFPDNPYFVNPRPSNKRNT